MIAENTLLGPYEILTPLGAGGMGEVYRARDTRLEREVAVKVLPANLAQNPAVLERFEREARALAALSHPNILAVYDVGEANGISFVVMELLMGETLHSRLQKEPIPISETLQIAISVAEGLSAAHARGIIHRDMKPENVFLADNSVVKILDFGLARFVDLPPEGNLSRFQTIEKKTSPGTILGTVYYMSPEQVRGQEVDERTDIFSFGSMLYEMLTGRHPFSAATPVETMASILKDDISGISGARNAPPDLLKVVRTCLQKDAAMRFASAQELSSALKSIAASGSWSRPEIAPPPAKKRKRKTIDSLAILPFTNASSDPDTEYLNDGITETIINTLSQIPKLRIMARSTVFRYKGMDVDAQTAGRDLNVRAVLTGRILPRGDLLNIQAELIDASDGARLWGEQYNREHCDILEAQQDISNKISQALRLKLVSGRKKRISKKPTENSEAYRLYLQGRFYWNKRTEDGLRRGIDYFERSIQEDPTFALAYSGLSDAYAILGGFGYIPAKEAYTRAKVEALKALELDDSLAEAHTSLATVLYRYDWNWAECEKEFQKAIECNPGHANAHHWYGVWLSLIGRPEEAITEVRRAIELDPLSNIIQWTLGFVQYYAREYDKAIQQYHKVLELDPTFGYVRIDLGIAYCLRGMFPEAIAEIKKGIGLLEENPSMLATLGYVYARAGERTEALKILEDLHEQSKRRYVSRYIIAIVYLGLGELEEAIAWIEKSCEEREDAMVSLGVNPRMDPIRSHPRFQALLRRIGLPYKPAQGAAFPGT